MKWIAIGVSLVVRPTVMPALADNPGGGVAGQSVGLSPGDIVATPEMWFYEQSLRRYQDPKVAVRQRAEFKANQRQGRIAARRWFGFSNARPSASTDPYHGDYSPRWSSNNVFNPFQWNGVGAAMVVLPPSGTLAY